MGEKFVRPGYSSTGEKLPIYPRPEPPITLIEQQNPLTPYIAQGRESATSLFGGAAGYVKDGVGRWITFERKVEHHVKAVLPPDEPLLPGSIYVLVSSLTASVLTRSRSFPIRFISPPLFALISLPYFLPKTSHNLQRVLSDLEDTHMPEFSQRHERFVSTGVAHFNMTLERIKGSGDDLRGWTKEAVEGVEKKTGLRLGQTYSSKVDKVEVERVGVLVEEKPVGEVVRLVETKEKRVV
ncbi:hypothetical protein TREMEDRAFT_45042 [Tremella mesenterica DSM 1558]|uniref:uncharacterized protein n=1 Tax=Tremella mesenterica (strain ATCC 24925 / CBS 8224 / DSM 1558 / NBRC 9311 / NRRL Y-6157 / RJB 2259-6 / UBC 559-6) TaxID=578456 RepID=UPI0003F4956B|nr:uncharacterized protein TREMEDRAFT_45042 [Tremella mesenterica DSM 1558]EIW68080.1 hypothetical protein TREMEDRAFT_45042 [Tremella mesenterica DSM 1558]